MQCLSLNRPVVNQCLSVEMFVKIRTKSDVAGHGRPFQYDALQYEVQRMGKVGGGPNGFSTENAFATMFPAKQSIQGGWKFVKLPEDRSEQHSGPSEFKLRGCFIGGPQFIF